MKLLAKFSLPDDLVVIHDRTRFVPTEDFKEIKNRVWKKLEKDLKNSDKPLWNGKIYRLSKFEGQTKIKIFLGKTDFKTHYATAFAENILKDLPLKQRPNGIYIAGYIQTSDHKFVFGEKTLKRNASIGGISLVGGNLNADELEIKNSGDLFQYFVNELKEETSLQEKNIQSLNGVGIFQAKNYRVAIIMDCLLNINSNQVFKKAKTNFEFKSLRVVTPEELKKMAKNINTNPNIKGTYKYFLGT